MNLLQEYVLIKPAARIFIFAALTLFFFPLSSQNLVPNGDFENNTGCPTDYSQFYVEDWFIPTAGSSDYFNSCDGGDIVSVPINFQGYQPAQSGNGYAGIAVAQTIGPVYREYIEAAISEPLLPGFPYQLQWYVNLSNRSSCAPASVCAYVSEEEITDFATTGIITPLTSVVQSVCSNEEINFSDTLNWQLIKTCFIANGKEKFLLIGNVFTNTVSPCTNFVDGTGALAYLYIDNVSLIPMPVQIINVDTIVCKGMDVVIDAEKLIVEPGNADITYTWSDGTVKPVKTLSNEGDYEVTIQNGCVADIVNIHIEYKTECPETFYVPNAFSPNNDGINDRFRIIQENITVTTFDIYNRWGIRVYNSNEGLNGWDGTFNGKDVETGVYLYLINYTTNISDQVKSKQGYITVIH